MLKGLEVIKRHHFCWEGEGEPGKAFGSEGFQAMPASPRSEDRLGRMQSAGKCRKEIYGEQSILGHGVREGGTRGGAVG